MKRLLSGDVLFIFRSRGILNLYENEDDKIWAAAISFLSNWKDWRSGKRNSLHPENNKILGGFQL